MLDKQCQEPVLFPKGRYGYTTERKVTISPVHTLMLYSDVNVEGLFATNLEYFFMYQIV